VKQVYSNIEYYFQFWYKQTADQKGRWRRRRRRCEEKNSSTEDRSGWGL